MPQSLPRSVVQSYGTIDIPAWYYTDGAGNPTSSGHSVPVDMGYEKRDLIFSVGNLFPYRNLSGFYQVTRYKRHDQTSSADIWLRTPFGFGWRYNGPVVFQGTGAPEFHHTFPSHAAAISGAAPYGPVGWNRTRPTKPLANLAQWVGELKDLPRVPLASIARIHTAMAGRPLGQQIDALRRALGSEYLNLDFGWKPFLTDLQKIFDFQRRFSAWHTRIRNSDAGRNQRRRITLKNSVSRDSSSFRTNVSGYMTGVGAICDYWGEFLEENVLEEKIWFVAGYRLLMPDLSTPENYAKVRNAMLGATPTIATAWQLTPWSWLAGWFSSVGDAIENAADPLSSYYAASYAFVMKQTHQYKRVTVTGSQTHPWVVGPANLSVSTSAGIITKLRLAASPFGFGFTWDGLSGSQIATATALGISRK